MDYRAAGDARAAGGTAGDRRLFAGRDVQVGATLPFRTAAYDLAGEVVRRDSVEPPGEPTTTTVTLRLANVQPERAVNIRAGQTETVRGETLARVLDRNAIPAVVILESEDGNIFEREHPRYIDLTLTVKLQTRSTTTDLRFLGRTVQRGLSCRPHETFIPAGPVGSNR